MYRDKGGANKLVDGQATGRMAEAPDLPATQHEAEVSRVWILAVFASGHRIQSLRSVVAFWFVPALHPEILHLQLAMLLGGETGPIRANLSQLGTDSESTKFAA